MRFWILGVLAACRSTPAPVPQHAEPRVEPTCIAHRLTGVVRFQDGERVAGATIVLELPPPVEPHLPVAITDENGEFVLQPAPPGEQRLTIYVLDITATKTYRQGPCTSEVEIYLHDPARPLFQ